MPGRRHSSAPPPACPLRDHSGSSVRRYGTRKTRGLTYARFRCAPAGEDPHIFQLPLDANGAVQRDTYLPPEPCLEHPGSRVVRAGTYESGGTQRQRYRCLPADGSPGHRFTPLLPRERVHDGQRCELCTEHVGVHRGETTAGRGHRASTTLVARALQRLARGESYGSVSVWARNQLSGDRVLAQPPTPQSAWRLAADWVEVFSPVLWAPFDEQQRAAAAERRRNGEPLVVVIDDTPIFAKQGSIGGGRQRFALLALAEVDLSAPAGRETSLRLLRAFATHDEDAYRLLFDELGYIPDFIVSDGASGIISAVRSLRRQHPERQIGWAISAHHIRDMAQDNIARSIKAFPGFQPGALLDDATSLRFVRSREAFDAWWEAMWRRMDSQNLPANLRWRRWQGQYKPLIEDGLTELDAWPGVPRSTGALEALIEREVEPTLTVRAQGFGNLIRTNALLDLVTLRLAGKIDRTGPVAEQLRQDVRANGGYAARVRDITDKGAYRSLLDPDVVEKLAKKRGLS